MESGRWRSVYKPVGPLSPWAVSGSHVLANDPLRNTAAAACSVTFGSQARHRRPCTSAGGGGRRIDCIEEDVLSGPLGF
jgi:hypothetical protein